MAYEKQDWSNGDIISEEKLNHIEDGISNALTEVDASALVNGATYLEVNNNIIDVKYNELKGDIATDITTGSNDIDDVNGKIDVDYNSLKTALDADLLTSNDSTLKNMCGSSLQITDSKLQVNVEFLAGDGLTTYQSNTIQVDLDSVGRDLVVNSNYLGFKGSGYSTGLGIKMNELSTALAGNGLTTNSNFQLDVSLSEVQQAIFTENYDDTYGEYITISNLGDVPTTNYVGNYVTDHAKGNMYFSFDENGGGETPTPMFQYYPSGEEYPSFIPSLPIIRKDINIGEGIPVLCYYDTDGPLEILSNVVYHDADGFYTVDGTGHRQSITV